MNIIRKVNFNIKNFEIKENLMALTSITQFIYKSYI